MPGAQVWPAAPGVRGLVDLGYRLRTSAVGGPVVPDARAGLVWLSDGTVRACGPETRPWAPARAGVDVVGIRLARGAAAAVLGVPAHVLTDRRLLLQDLWGQAALDLADQMVGAGGDRARAVLLQEAVAARGVDAAQVDPVARHLAQRLAHASVGVRELADEVGLSQRQLHRRCAVAFGYPPSLLARVLRLHRFLAAARAARLDVRLADLAAGAGYADHAHLARDVRALTGRRPSQCLPSLAASDPFKPAADQDF